MRCFEQLGIGMKLQVNTFSQFRRGASKGRSRCPRAHGIADYPDPEDFLDLLYGPNAPPGPNASAFRTRSTTSCTADESHGGYAGAGGLIHRMVAIVVEECPWIFNFHSPSYVLRHSWYKNGKSHSIRGTT